MLIIRKNREALRRIEVECKVFRHIAASLGCPFNVLKSAAAINKACARPQPAAWVSLPSTPCKKVLKAEAFVPLLKKCHENIEAF